MMHTAQHPRARLAWYGFTLFLSSALLLVLEITAGRLLAPYVGVTLYSWTSIIGVILAGLSLGNWLGGRWADHGARERSTGIALALAGVFSLLSLLFLSLLAPLLNSSSLDLISASFLYVLAMFFIPAVFLGIPAPILTTLALSSDSRTGRIVGRLHALAALGSIVGTFLTGFVLVQHLGSRNIIFLSSMLLFLLAIPYLLHLKLPTDSRGPGVSALLLVVGVGVSSGIWIQARNGFANPCDRESAYFCLRVVDASDQAPFGSARALVLDHLLHGINHEGEPGMLISSYVQLVDELVIDHFGVQRLDTLSYFFAGGGAYTQPRAVQAMHPQATIVVAEIDPVVTEVARQKLFLDSTGMTILHRDARMALQHTVPGSFDVIVTDAFHDIAVPYHLVTREFMALVASRLRDDGMYVTNMVDIHPDPKLVKSYVKTLWTEFNHVEVWAEELPDTTARLTYVITASQRKTDGGRNAGSRLSDLNPRPEILDARRGFERRWFRIDKELTTTGTPYIDLPVLTDNFAPVESLISGLLFSDAGS